MSDRIPLTEKKEYELVIKDQDSEIVIRELSVIGSGGSCIVYKGKKCLSAEIDGMENCTVIVKEFYPAGIGISRQNDMSLLITDENLFNEMKNHFAEGQANHAKFYEYYQDLTLPRMFFYGNANNTAYAVSDPGKGRTLSEINFDTLSLKHIASIMESICSAIRKIHSKKMLYLDCKPDNFFYYGKKSDLQTKVYLFDFDTIISLKDVQNGKNVFCSASFGWIPPEQELISVPLTDAKQYRSPQQIGYHTDIYSIGAVFFWLLTQRKPTAEDINSVLNHTFDWEKESAYCSGEEQEVIDIIQDISESSLQPDVEIRSKMFRHFISINAVQDQYRNLYGLKAGDDVHFEPIHSAIKRLEEELLAKADRIIDDVKAVSGKIDNLQTKISNMKDSKSEIPFRKTTTKSRFQYTVKASAFSGRKAEIDYLIDMCNDTDNLFSWVGICGSGGAGKSRLAYQLCDIMQERGWKVYAPSHARITAQNIETEMSSISRDILICFDDVKSDIDVIIDFIYYCVEAPIELKNKIRIVLIDRDFKDTFLGCSNVLIYRYQKQSIFFEGIELCDGFICLRRQSPVEICSIMKSFALNVYHKSVSDEELENLYKSFKEVDKEERPLYSLFVCDAWCNGNNVNNWHRNDALDMAANKEYEKAQDLIKSEYVRKSEQFNALNAVKCVIALSGFTSQITFDRLGNFLFNQYRINFDDSFQWIINQLGLIEEDKLENAYPDILSEYMSLRFINSLNRNQAIFLYNTICSNADQRTFQYGGSICEDYGDLLIAPSNMSVMQFLTEELEVRIGEQVSAELSEQELEEFDGIDDAEFAKNWLNQHCPYYRDIVNRCITEISDYFMKNKDKIFKSVDLDLTSGAYSGETVFDWRCGKGRHNYTDGIIYDGEWNKNIPNGTGKMTWNDGTQYYGEFKNGKFHGQGVMDFAGGSKFMGEFRDGMRYHGKLVSAEGWEYEGSWAGNLPDGFGKQTMSDGSSYNGEWKEGKCCGKGVFISKTGEKKEGIWLDNQLVEEL